MRFEKAYERSEQGRLGRAPSKLVGPDSGQVDEALRPTLRPKRCRKRCACSAVTLRRLIQRRRLCRRPPSAFRRMGRHCRWRNWM